MLEFCYGEGMMSEGGANAIETMFQGIPLHRKKALEIGFGLAGTMFYLAKQYAMSITGLEINDTLVKEAERRTPNDLKSQLEFYTYHPDKTLPFPNQPFDIIFSKGVLTHLKDKQTLFQNIFRALKPNGYLVINDWLSPTESQWSPKIQTMCEREGLLLFPETKNNYLALLSQCGFTDIKIIDESTDYARYNRDIVKHLNQPLVSEKFIEKYGHETFEEFIDSYKLIAEAMEQGELIVTLFQARR